jgi:hypothetical protein
MPDWTTKTGNCFEGMRVATPTASGASCVLGLQRAWAQPRTDSSTCSATSSHRDQRKCGLRDQRECGLRDQRKCGLRDQQKHGLLRDQRKTRSAVTGLAPDARLRG